MKTGIKNSIVALGIFGISLITTGNVFAGYFNSTPVAQCQVQITHTLQVGSSISDVYTLQEMLSRASYLHVAPNGYFGPSTKQAVMNFQIDNGISATGYVGESTMNAINERLCDIDPRGDSLSYYGYSTTGVTYVDQYDPYAVVVSPQTVSPVVYTTPQPFSTVNSIATVQSSPILSSAALLPATSQIQSTNIIYNSGSGYTYSIVPRPGSLTITNPGINSFYNEGDTVVLTWTTNNLNISGVQVLLENTSTKQSAQAAFSTSNNSSFVLTKELLDTVCAGGCDNNQQGSFRIVLVTPVTDIAGITSNFRAAVAPITIKRPYWLSANVSISASRTPVDSGEKFKLYLNIPAGTSWNNNMIGNYSIKIRALCPSSVSVVVAGVSCGQDFVIPFAPVSFQQEIPAMITNPTWYRQDVIFEVVVTSLNGQVIGTSRTNVTANSAPFSW